MPASHTEIKLTDKFSALSGEEINKLKVCQPAPKYMLRCMKELGKDNKPFTYETLVEFMKVPNNQKLFYTKWKTSKKSLSENNIGNYWGLASQKHNASIPEFEDYYKFCPPATLPPPGMDCELGNSPIMSTNTIQPVIDIYCSQLSAALEKLRQEQLSDFKKRLIDLLAKKYEFDVDEAMVLVHEHEL
jgi:hypothetical protein